MNAFMVWSKQARRRLALKHPNLLNCEISRLLGNEWASMSENDKKPFIEEFYPGYSYRPLKKKDNFEEIKHHKQPSLNIW